MIGELASSRRQGMDLGLLVMLAVASWVCYLAVALGRQSLHEEGTADHSLLTILALFGIAFLCYLESLRIALCARQDGRLLAVIVGAAVAFRVTMLFSDPVEEIDLYRYLWDGRVTLAGVSPFRYSPEQVLAASSRGDLPPDLASLVAIRDASSVLQTVMRRIHFGTLTTIYPPVAQLIFALATLTTPADASVPARMTVMKAWFVGFDLATLALVISLLKFTCRPVGWSVAYGWCPLVIKEVANSGHLDALAVFLTTLALSLAAWALFRPPGGSARAAGAGSLALRGAIASCVVLALAVGAKLYPVVLAPMFFFGFMRHFGWRRTLAPAAAFGLMVLLLLWPMLPSKSSNAPHGVVQGTRDDDQPPLPPWESFSVPPAPAPEPGVVAFASEWEMNDFLFLLLMENLRPYAQVPLGERAWFSVVPERWREALIGRISSRVAIAPWRVPFFLSRALMTALFLVLAGWFAWDAAKANDPAVWLRPAFLTLAWFWLLLPTLNPWYWTWAMPLLPFARSRAWLALSGLVFLYYLRFWLTYHFAETPVLGTRYAGPWFFDFVVSWLEYGPWFVWLGMQLGKGEMHHGSS
jgi:hypothetical protein